MSAGEGPAIGASSGVADAQCVGQTAAKITLLSLGVNSCSSTYPAVGGLQLLVVHEQLSRTDCWQVYTQCCWAPSSCSQCSTELASLCLLPAGRLLKADSH